MADKGSGGGTSGGGGGGGGKKSSYNFRRGLEFQADTPDFIKRMMGGGGHADKRAGSKEQPELGLSDSDEPEDEMPQVLAGRGVSEADVDRFLGKSGKAGGSGGSGAGKRAGGGGQEDDQDGAGDDDGDDDNNNDGKIKFRRPSKKSKTDAAGKASSVSSLSSKSSAQRSASARAGGRERKDAGKEAQAAALQSRSTVKKVKNKTLLSFDDEQE
ncbi:hypothetical protein BC831DRAFT_441674 [Entophlyctis helioformis]|nr:hypothetical protein BC831DRAFT_441674 [Entophlyctis helioformis]